MKFKTNRSDSRRYVVHTHNSKTGAEKRTDYNSFDIALTAANSYRDSEEYAAIYDKDRKTAFVIFGNPFAHVFASYVTIRQF